jgi:hypothetical protein
VFDDAAWKSFLSANPSIATGSSDRKRSPKPAADLSWGVTAALLIARGSARCGAPVQRHATSRRIVSLRTRSAHWQSESKQGTDAELLTAIKRRDAILGDPPDFAASGAWGCSGNGAWILVRLADYPNDAHHASLLAKALAVLNQKYSDNIVRIDTATANPARLIGLPGTMRAKGCDRPDRPWRRVTLDGFGT